MSNDIKVYRHALSGHCHRIELMLSLLGLPATFIDVDLAAGEHKASPFLDMNAFAQVPVIDDQGLSWRIQCHSGLSGTSLWFWSLVTGRSVASSPGTTLAVRGGRAFGELSDEGAISHGL